MVSIIIPVYNAEEYLARCLDSVINQTHTDLEIILVNDGSGDSSGDVCLDYAKRDKRIRYIYKKNEGAGAARYCGAEMATGDYLFFVDSDDYLEIDAIEKMLNYMDEEIDCVVGQHKRFGQCDGIKQVSFPIGLYNFESDLYHKYCVGEMLNGLHGVELWNKLFRASVVKKSWKYPIRVKFGEDMLALNLIFLNCRNIRCIETITYYYEYRENSLARSTNHLMILPRFSDECIKLEKVLLEENWSAPLISLVIYSVLSLALVKYQIDDALARQKLICDIEQISEKEEMRKYAKQFLNHRKKLKRIYGLSDEQYFQAITLYKAIVHKDAWYYTRLYPALLETNSSWLYVTKAYINKIVGRIKK